MKKMLKFEDFVVYKCDTCGESCEPLSIKDSMFGLINGNFCKEHLKKEQLKITRKEKLKKLNGKGI